MAAWASLKSFRSGSRITVDDDKACGTREFVQSLRALNAVPHGAQNGKGRKSAMDRRYPPSGLRPQSTPAQTGRGNLWLVYNQKTPVSS
ncbi:MAG: hypothetical protein JRI57_06755 [Deltaproteobacteria bacterium]|nr:hypothetical protein [Deltaproteobacteria bacterium]